MQKINLVIPDNMDYRTSEAYRTLRTNVLFCGEEMNAIAVTSCTPGEGKSEVSFRLAESLAETDRSLLYRCGSSPLGILKTISGHAGSKRAFRLSVRTGRTGCSRMCYEYCQSACYPSGASTRNPSELLGNEHFRQLMEKTHALYDYIIIDTPPLGSVIDAAVIAKECDGAMLVIENDAISYKMAQKVERQLERSGMSDSWGGVKSVMSEQKGIMESITIVSIMVGIMIMLIIAYREVEERKESTEEK